MAARTTNVLQKNWQLITIALLVILLAGAVVWAIGERGQTSQFRNQASSTPGHENMSVEDAMESHGIAPLSAKDASNNSETAKELAYLLEEEKLAHDVYQAMYDKWGARVFGNIKGSETMHGDMVWAVMESRSLSDPRKTEFGKFTNPELQTLYDQLIARGNQSVTDAYKVGVSIEEKDIADLKETLAKLDAKDTDVKDVIDNLIRSSENHLRAFSRQANP